MSEEQVQAWLDKEAKKGNTLAESYLALLVAAPTPMRSYWFNHLGIMLSATKNIVDALKEEQLGEK